MQKTLKLRLLGLMLLALASLLTACSSVPMRSPPPLDVQEPAKPPLPASAKQLPRSQTYSADAQQEFDSWMSILTTPGPVDSSANGTTTPPSAAPAPAPPFPNH